MIIVITIITIITIAWALAAERNISRARGDTNQDEQCFVLCADGRDSEPFFLFTIELQLDIWSCFSPSWGRELWVHDMGAQSLL